MLGTNPPKPPNKHPPSKNATLPPPNDTSPNGVDVEWLSNSVFFDFPCKNPLKPIFGAGMTPRGGCGQIWCIVSVHCFNIPLDGCRYFQKIIQKLTSSKTQTPRKPDVKHKDAYKHSAPANGQLTKQNAQTHTN